MAMVLQQALRGLCYKSGWSYAVFWKLKRRSRMVLTWEDGFYEFSKSSVSSFDPAQPNGGYMMTSDGRRSATDTPTADVPGSEDQLGLAVARMSYHVYSLGEGIIGRVAFTGKHQWVFGDRGSAGEGNPSGRSGRAISEKYPAGWQQQFAAGIKTIAVVAVPQGIVQLGHTQIVMEDLTLVSHVRALFGTLQSVPGAFLSDYVPESQDGRVAAPSMVMPMPMMMLMGANHNNIAQLQMGMSNVPQAATTGIGTGSYDMRNMAKPMMPVRPHLSNPFLPSPVNPFSSMPLQQQTSRITPSPLLNRDSPAKNLSLLSTVSMAVGNRQSLLKTISSSCPEVSPPIPTSSNSRPSIPSPITARNWKSLIPVPPVVSKSKLATSADRTDPTGCDQLHSRLMQKSVPVSRISVSQDTLGSVRLPLQRTSLTGGSVPELSGTHCKPSETYTQQEAYNYTAAESCRAESTSGTASGTVDVTGAVVETDSRSREQSEIHSGSPEVVPLVPTGRPSPVGESMDLSFKSASLKVPSTEGRAGNWPQARCDEKSKPESQHIISGGYVAPLIQSHYERNIKSCQQPAGVVDSACCKETFRLSSQTLGDVAGFADAFVPVPESSGSRILDTKESTELGGGSVDTLPEMPSDVWSGSYSKGDWDCFSSLVCPFPIGDELSQALRPSSSRNRDGEPLNSLLQQRISLDTAENSQVHSIGSNTRLSSSDINGAGKDGGISSLDYDIFKAAANAVLVDSRSEPLLEAVVAGIAGVSSFPFAPYAPSSVPSVPSPSKVDSSSQERNSSASSNALPGEPECIVQRNESSCWAASSGETLNHDANPSGVSPCTGEIQGLEKLSGPGSSDLQRENMWRISQDPVVVNGDGGPRRGDDEFRPPPSMPPTKRHFDFGKTGNSRKKAKHGETQRPRPKDRQQIQDRVKELREIVPNACKCSIDALLEKTIKHMNFLQTVTQHGEKWKQLGDLKEDTEFPLEHSNACSDLQGVDGRLETGAVVSSQLGKLDSGCPVVVQNLNHSRQMLIEMMCEERGLFLEIADTVRKLGLTILKGSMESRSEKTWVRFVVEATSRDIHRVEVLWNLTQLLKPTSAIQQASAPHPGYDTASDYMDPNCLRSEVLGNTSSSLSSSFPNVLGPSVPLQMSAR
ncbi:hypothetical protein R1flu_024367 [Riccia fluitans]|uniref:BHLH domain-containing protein n=1 Tax=Riccia fluitans TaxID=41844 RepID=A0ABD1XUQ0_9MARC